MEESPLANSESATASMSLADAHLEETPLEKSDSAAASMSLADVHLEETPLEKSDSAAASMSLADVNLMEKGGDAELQEELLNETDDNSSLENDEEFGRGEKANEKRKGLCTPLWAILAACVMIILALGLGLGLGLNKGNRPTFSEIVLYLSNGVSTRSELIDEGSPQNKAARWLAEKDAAALPLPKHTDGRLWDFEEDRDAYMYMFRYVMVLNYFATSGENWYKKMNFLTARDVCEWNGSSLGVDDHYPIYSPAYVMGGVTCDDESGLPFALDLEFNDMEGEIPKENGLLRSLSIIDIQFNEIGGGFPEALCNLDQVEFLFLHNNNFVGSLPSCISNWSKNLRLLQLENNELSGSFPPEICELTNLEVLVLDRNQFKGTLPSCISSELHNLRLFSLSDNMFGGNLPNFSQWSQLNQLFLDGNTFIGDPIPSIQGLSKLQLLYLEDNEFTGNLQDLASQNMPHLEALDLSHNNFKPGTGNNLAVPPELLLMKNLTILDLSNNLLEGNFPSDLPKQESLVFLSVHQNKLSGSIPGASIANLQSLRHLDLANNDFTGNMPDELFNDMTQLDHLFLSENPLAEGPIPEGLKTMTDLTELSLKNTNRNGPLPELLNFDNLMLLDLNKNNFEGNIPSNYNKLTSLLYLLLNDNPLVGGTMPALSQLRDLSTVLVDGTGVTGNFSSICQLPAFPAGEPAAAVADCGEGFADKAIQCSCCHCCDKSSDGKSCSDPVVDSLDWDWEKGFTERARDFGIDLELLEGGPSSVPQDGNRRRNRRRK